MNNPVEQYEQNGLTVSIYQDNDPESPREWDNLGVMICSHRNYTLGDEQFNSDDYEGWDDLKQYLIKERGAIVILPLGLYDHSGITMYVGEQHDRWDGGQVGFIFCTKKEVDEYDGTPQEKLEKAEACLRSEVETYDQYLTGEVYGFSVTNPKNGEEIDSCWGFFGDIKYVKEEANSAADHFVQPHEAAYAKNAGVLHG